MSLIFKPGAKRHHMVSGTLAPLYSFWVKVGLKRGSGPDRGRSPVEWGDFPSVRPSVPPRLALRPSQLALRPSDPSSWPSDPSCWPSEAQTLPASPQTLATCHQTALAGPDTPPADFQTPLGGPWIFFAGTKNSFYRTSYITGAIG